MSLSQFYQVRIWTGTKKQLYWHPATGAQIRLPVAKTTPHSCPASSAPPASGLGKASDPCAQRGHQQEACASQLWTAVALAAVAMWTMNQQINSVFRANINTSCKGQERSKDDVIRFSAIFKNSEIIFQVFTWCENKIAL